MMKKDSVKTPLIEGKSYPFKISGSVDLPDGTECYILTDVNGVKHLLQKQYYSHYRLELNSEILCRIDKINCTGKIFIEPLHPFYKMGASYRFTFDRYIETESTYGEPEKLAVLKNGHAEDVYLSADEIDRNLEPGEMLEAIVERVKKGQVYLTLGSSVNDYTGLEAGKRYRFTLDRELHVGGRYAYYVLRADNGKEFRIRKKFYSKYGLAVGDMVTCELVETDHQVFLEPVHPFYEIGFIYEFRVVGKTLINEYPERRVEAFLLENKYGKNAVIKKNEIDPKQINGDTIKCTVTAILKSRIYLACT